ncbi:hypothetical protein F2Q70_00013918 [Brassica cretica]|uniref:Uncharacterized protein n=1 Tax=Brassica cretica TaxID=69181 RepID=A0A8S9M8T9_BRACR|nr:hypothetical protein F2Q70_00013918 [Brassica cretica]
MLEAERKRVAKLQENEKSPSPTRSIRWLDEYLPRRESNHKGEEDFTAIVNKGVAVNNPTFQSWHFVPNPKANITTKEQSNPKAQRYTNSHKRNIKQIIFLASGLGGSLGDDGKRVQSTIQLLPEQIVHKPVPLHQIHPFESLRYDLHIEMRLFVCSSTFHPACWYETSSTGSSFSLTLIARFSIAPEFDPVLSALLIAIRLSLKQVEESRHGGEESRRICRRFHSARVPPKLRRLLTSNSYVVFDHTLPLPVAASSDSRTHIRFGADVDPRSPSRLLGREHA